MNKTINLIHGDCLEEMKKITDQSIDMILTDPPYGTTACKWDAIIPFDLMWLELNRVIRDNGVIALFGSEPFSSVLRVSNLVNFKYDWVWQKDKSSGFLNAKKQPLRSHEIISIFYKKPPTYNPQFWETKPMNTVYKGGATSSTKTTDVYGSQKVIYKEEFNQTKRYPITNLKFNGVNGQAKDKTAHPTQKPVALLEYLIKTYTLEGETVLDFTMGSGSTGVAAKNLNRNFIGIEKDDNYFEIARRRINEFKNLSRVDSNS